jgi:hypothetical protein
MADLSTRANLECCTPCDLLDQVRIVLSSREGHHASVRSHFSADSSCTELCNFLCEYCHDMSNQSHKSSLVTSSRLTEVVHALFTLFVRNCESAESGSSAADIDVAFHLCAVALQEAIGQEKCCTEVVKPRVNNDWLVAVLATSLLLSGRLTTLEVKLQDIIGPSVHEQFLQFRDTVVTGTGSTKELFAVLSEEATYPQVLRNGTTIVAAKDAQQASDYNRKEQSFVTSVYESALELIRKPALRSSDDGIETVTAVIIGIAR